MLLIRQPRAFRLKQGCYEERVPVKLNAPNVAVGIASTYTQRSRRQSRVVGRAQTVTTMVRLIAVAVP